jgi:hypothetical protein
MRRWDDAPFFDNESGSLDVLYWVVFSLPAVVAAVMLVRNWAEEFPNDARIAADVSGVIFSIVWLRIMWNSRRLLRAGLLRTWRFLRSGENGSEGQPCGITPGDSLTRLLTARKSLALESHVISLPARPTVLHCPMCRAILIGYPTDRVRCPKCEAGISYIHSVIEIDAVITSG